METLTLLLLTMITYLRSIKSSYALRKYPIALKVVGRHPLLDATKHFEYKIRALDDSNRPPWPRIIGNEDCTVDNARDDMPNCS